MVKKKSNYMSKEARILRLFKDKRRVTQRELNRISYRYGSVIHDLRKENHNIVTIPIDHSRGHFEYAYKGKKEVVKANDVVNFNLAYEEKTLIGKIKSKIKARR